MSMTTNNTTALALKCIELFNQHTLNYVEQCYAEDVDWTEMPLPTTPEGQRGNRESLLRSAGMLLRLFPDRELRVVNIVTEGNSVAMELDWSGTAASTVGPVKAGSVYHSRIASFLMISNNLIVKHTDYCVAIPERGKPKQQEG